MKRSRVSKIPDTTPEFPGFMSGTIEVGPLVTETVQALPEVAPDTTKEVLSGAKTETAEMDLVIHLTQGINDLELKINGLLVKLNQRLR